MRLRTLSQAYKDIKAQDENTAITKHYIRQALISGRLKYMQVGNKRLITMEDLEALILSEFNQGKESGE